MTARQISPSTGTAADVSEALARTAERYHSLVERVGYGIYCSTADGRLLEANSVLVAMLGYSSVDEVLALDMNADVYLDPDDRGRLRRRPTSSLPDWVETRWKRRDGSAITVRLSARHILDGDGHVVAY